MIVNRVKSHIKSYKITNIFQFSKLHSNSIKFSVDNETRETISEQNKPLYKTHIPTSFLQKTLLTVGSSVMSISDVYRHDMVAVMGETSGVIAAKKIKEKMLQDSEGSVILIEKPRINSSTLNYDYLKSLPRDTLGYAYMNFLQKHDVTPDSRRDVTFVDDPDLAYVIQRYREVHDLNHTLLGMPTNLLGEISIKWVEAIQTGFPMCVTAALFGPIRLKSNQREKYVKYYLPWAIECGHKAKFLMNYYYENRWEQNLNDLKLELNVPEFISEK